MGATVIAFWKYDAPPYLLHGKIDPTRRSTAPDATRGMVYIPKYLGWYRPEFVLSDKKGTALAKSLDALTRRYEHNKDALYQDYMRQRESALTAALKG